jgi:hypothetical protein
VRIIGHIWIQKGVGLWLGLTLRRKNGHWLLLLLLSINLDVSPLIVDASTALKDSVPATSLA